MKFNVEDLVSKGLVKKKTYTSGEFKGLSVLKYSNKVFWENLWDQDSRLLDCRGMVVDSDDNIVVWPFTKIFNHLENGTDLPKDMVVNAARKVNGFMAAVSSYNGELIVSTTGTLDSDFAKLAKGMIMEECTNLPMLLSCVEEPKTTFIFEICAPSDPHIVPEKAGVYLIGVRFHKDKLTSMLSEKALDLIAKEFGFKRPETYINMHFSDILEMSKECKHEGFVLRAATGQQDLLLKIKSPHYLAKKFLMRGGKNKWDMIWGNPEEAKKKVDEEYYNLLNYLRDNYSKEHWECLHEQFRREIIEDFFGGTI